MGILSAAALPRRNADAKGPDRVHLISHIYQIPGRFRVFGISFDSRPMTSVSRWTPRKTPSFSRRSWRSLVTSLRIGVTS